MENSKYETRNQKQIRNSNLFFRLFLLCFVFLISNFVFKTTIHASDVSLVVSPPRIDLEGKPGDTLQQTVKITNNGEQEIILQSLVADFIVNDDAGTPIKVSESASGRYLASPWFTLNDPEIVLQPKQTVSLIVLIDVPADALPGGHYAGVFFQPVPARGLKQTVSYTTAQVGSLFGINVAGDINYDALIKDFTVSSRLSEFGPIDFSTTIENQSDTHIKPVATITVHDLLGRKRTDLTLPEVNVFPYTSRTLSGTWDTVWGFGRYSATLELAYGPGLTASRTLYFWILPYRLMIAVGVVLLVLLVVIILVRRHLKSRFDHRDDEIDELKRKIAELENQHSQG